MLLCVCDVTASKRAHSACELGGVLIVHTDVHAQLRRSRVGNFAMSRKKLLATSEAGFISVESSTPEKPVGTFIPALGMPRRSPRLAAKRKRCQAESLPQPSVYESAPADPGVPSSTLEAVRKVARSGQVVELLDHVKSYVEAKYQLDASIVKAETSNEVQRYVVVSRRIKAFDESVGPYDSLRLVVEEGGEFRLLSHDKSLIWWKEW